MFVVKSEEYFTKYNIFEVDFDSGVCISMGCIHKKGIHDFPPKFYSLNLNFCAKSLKMGQNGPLYREICLQFLLLLSSSFFFFFFLSTSLFLLQLTWYDHVTQVIFISLMTATKLMGLEIHLGSFGVTGVKKVNHVKNMKTALI